MLLCDSRSPVSSIIGRNICQNVCLTKTKRHRVKKSTLIWKILFNHSERNKRDLDARKSLVCYSSLLKAVFFACSIFLLFKAITKSLWCGAVLSIHHPCIKIDTINTKRSMSCTLLCKCLCVGSRYSVHARAKRSFMKRDVCNGWRLWQHKK